MSEMPLPELPLSEFERRMLHQIEADLTTDPAGRRRSCWAIAVLGVLASMVAVGVQVSLAALGLPAGLRCGAALVEGVALGLFVRSLARRWWLAAFVEVTHWPRFHRRSVR